MFYYLFLVLLLMFNSCQKQTLKERHSQLYLNFQEGDLLSLHPHLLSIHIRGRAIGKLLFEGLTRIDSEGNPSLAGAASVDISSDGLKYFFRLRKNCWSDGTPVTADHYILAWKHALTPGSDCPRADLFYLIKNGKKAKKGEVSLQEVGLHVLDTNTFIVELEYPCPYFLKLITQPFWAPLKVLHEEPKVFNGPFVIKERDKGRSIRLVPNQHFWNADAITLKQINIHCIEDSSTAFYMFEKQQIDWIGEPISLISREIASQLMEKNLAVIKPFDCFYWIHLNTTHPLLKSAKIRKALSLSIERKQITKHICAAGEPVLTPVHERMIPLQTEQESIVKAQNLFEEGLQELGLTKEHCPSLTISYAHFASQRPLVQYLKNHWEETLGISIQLQGNEWNVFRHNLGCGAFEIGGSIVNALYGDPMEFLERFEELGNYNFPQWENDLFKKQLSLVRKQTDERTRMQHLIEAEKILIDQTPFIPVYQHINVYAHHPSLKNYVFDASGCVDFAYASFQNQTQTQVKSKNQNIANKNFSKN